VIYAPFLVEVKSIGEDVVIAVGTWNRRLHFETAVMLASWLDECARDAKLWAGQTRQLLRAVGTLHDASDHKWLDRGQPFTPNGVPRVTRDLLKQKDIAVRQEGGTVVLTAGTSMMAIPYAAALQISQWIRLKAKESQMRAGDATRHWSKIVLAHEHQHGPGVTRG
jgi:hypothetical protein